MKQLAEIYGRTLAAVSAAANLSTEALLLSRTEHATTARAVLVSVLFSTGWSETMLAAVSGMSQQRINNIRNSNAHREKTLLFRIIREETEQLLLL